MSAAPIARMRPDDGTPAWQQIVELFERASLDPPPVRLRDQLVTVLAWARYGEALAAATAPEAVPPRREVLIVRAWTDGETVNVILAAGQELWIRQPEGVTP